jgi:uncharacterized damage-inducible protein DinB
MAPSSIPEVSMRPEDAKVVAEFLLSLLEHEIRTTTSLLTAVPGNALNYQPDPKSKSALALIRHLTLEDEWILNSVADGTFAPIPDDSDQCGIMTPGEAVARYAERIPSAIARVRGMSGEALVRPIDFFGNMVPAVVILSVMLRHSVHHRGQLSSYIRPMGGKVPSIYGPSADTQVATAQ